ncbi:MAG: hypothetical protein FWE53_02940 [Firmicutes bacterium]|nr:hypothetical protein [Bacillota bacterium]
MIGREWGKILLTVYKNLDAICDCLDSLVVEKGISSRLQGFSTEKTVQLMETMLELTERKIKFINLKLIIENALKAMDEKSRKALLFRYSDCYSFQTIALLTQVTLRTAQRKVAIAEKRYEFKLNQLGYTDGYLCEKYGNEPLITGVCQRLNSDKRYKKNRLAKLKADGYDNYILSTKLKNCNVISAR